MDIEELLSQEIREKKKYLSGARNRTGKKGYVGAVRFPSDFMSRKEKREYIKAGKVVTFNMYDTIMNYVEFVKLSDEDKKKTLTEYRKRFSNGEIIRGMGVSTTTYYKLVKELGVPRTHRKRTTNKNVVSAVEIIPSANVTHSEPKYKIDGLNLSFNGQYSPKEIVRRLEKIALLLDGEESNFQIEFSIRELGE